MNTEKKLSFTEDWTSVVLGLIIVAFVISGFQPVFPKTNWKNTEELFSLVLSVDNLFNIFIIFLVLRGIVAIGHLLQNKKFSLAGFPVIFLLTMLAQIFAGNDFIKSLGLEAVIFSLLIGLSISNFFNTPEWLKRSIDTELFTKIGLVLLGSGVIFHDILKAGMLGLIQSLVVVISVWYFAFWLCKRLKIDEELTMMIASSVSICGVSAAIATAGAIKGDNKKLSYVISLVLIVAVPMMIFLPYVAKVLELPQAVTGAWLGGTIDTTGAVVASGTLVGEVALKFSTIIKFSQNVLLGIAAFAISIYWSYMKKKHPAEKTGLGMIWERFPKFVIGFIVVSLLFSFLLSPDVIKSSKDSLKAFQGIWFGLAFTCIGLETKFTDLLKFDNGRPAYAFLMAQLFNILICLLLAWILFRNI